MNVKRGLDRLLIYVSVLYFIGLGVGAALWTGLADVSTITPPPYPSRAEALESALLVIGAGTLSYIVIYGLIWVAYGFYAWDLPMPRQRSGQTD